MLLSGSLVEWELVLYGTKIHPQEKTYGPHTCPHGQYLQSNVTRNQTVLNTCRQCHYTCKACMGSSPEECTECQYDYIKRDLYCILVQVKVVQLDSLFLFAWVVLLCVLAIVLFLIVFFTLQARDNGFCCWGSPMYDTLKKSSSNGREYEYHELTKNGDLTEDDDEEQTLFKDGGKVTTPGV